MNPHLDQPQATPEAFIPTPERLASFPFLEIKQEEAHDLLMSVKGRKELLSRILPHASDIQSLHPDFNPEVLPRQLEEISGLLLEHEKFLNAANSKEKKSLFQRALQTIKEFPKNHPFITSVLAIALLTAGLIRLGYLKFPNLGGWFGLGGGAEAGAKGVAGAAEAAAEAGGIEAEQLAVQLPDIVMKATKAAEAFKMTPNDFVIVGRQILFQGKLYDATDAGMNLDPLEVTEMLRGSGLADALKKSGIVDAGEVRVFYDASARYTTWAGLNHLLHQTGVDPIKVNLYDQMLEVTK